MLAALGWKQNRFVLSGVCDYIFRVPSHYMHRSTHSLSRLIPHVLPRYLTCYLTCCLTASVALAFGMDLRDFGYGFGFLLAIDSLNSFSQKSLL